MAHPSWEHPRRGVPGSARPWRSRYGSSNDKSGVRDNVLSPSANISNSRVSARSLVTCPCPSYDKAVLRTSSPKLSDVGSDRDVDRELSKMAFRGSLASLDPHRVSTPQKVGSLPYVPCLDRPDRAGEQAGEPATSVVVDAEVHRPPQPPTPALRTTVPAVSRRRHPSSVRDLRIGQESASGEDNLSHPVMSLGRSTPPQHGDRLRPSVRPASRQSCPHSSGDVSLTDVISKMRALELEGFAPQRTTSDGGRSARRSASSEDSWLG